MTALTVTFISPYNQGYKYYIPMETQALSSDSRRNFQRRFDLWREHGVSTRAAVVLALSGCDTVERIAELGRQYFAALGNCGVKTLAELAALAGWSERRTPADAIAAALGLSIADPGECREAAIDAVNALGRSGFVIVAGRRSAPAGRRQLAEPACQRRLGL